MVNHHGFDRMREEKNVAEFNDNKPITYNELPIRKARLIIVIPNSKGKKLCEKGYFITSLINGLGDAMLQVR
jgi:hypothetical protein